MIGVKKHKTIRKATHADAYYKNSSFKIHSKSDTFLKTTTTRVYSPVNSDSGSSSSGGGGSSTHRSSSGSTHGGGGRRF